MQPISIRYLYNSGFAVETASHFLIFDYLIKRNYRSLDTLQQERQQLDKFDYRGYNMGVRCYRSDG